VTATGDSSRPFECAGEVLSPLLSLSLEAKLGVVRGWGWGGWGSGMRANEIILIGATFTTYSAAQTRSCNNQHNACADIANNKVVSPF
jgi:hypothetical protein